MFMDNVINYEHTKSVIENAKKLTTKDRKKLSKSVYCGPQKSFPCNDCKHVSAAKAYLGRSKFSASTKKKIATCINKKAKQLGCGSANKEKSSEEYPKFISLSYEEKKLYSSEIFKETKHIVDESIKTPEKDLVFD